MRVAVPIEIYVREFDGKLWLSLHLLQDGHEVVIGNESWIHRGLDVTQPDCYVNGGSFQSEKNIGILNELEDNGCNVLFLDTEGGIFNNDEQYSGRITDDILSSISHFLAWGEKPRDIIGKKDIKVPITVTGNPRFEILKKDTKYIYKKFGEDLSQKHGRYILINTNFTIANYKEVGYNRKNNFQIEQDIFDYNYNMVREFIELLDHMSDQMDEKIIIRPHPSESDDIYKKLSSNKKNVIINQRHDVREWISGAIAVIHNGCTTGVESALLNTPTISYEPISSKHNNNLPNFVSESIVDKDKIVNRIRDIQSQNDNHNIPEKGQRELKKYLGVHKNSAQIITDIVSDYDSPADDFERIDNTILNLKKSMYNLIGNKRMMKLKQTEVKRSWSLSNQKFPYLGPEKIESRINILCEHTDIDSSEITIERINELENVFILRS